MRLGLFLHHQSAFNQALYNAIRRGFEAHGVIVDGGTSWLGEDAMHAWCRSFRPDAVLEMNRSRDNAPGLPLTVPHIAWIVDTLGHDWSWFDGSEILYLFGKPWCDQHPYPRSGLVDWLPPGFDSEFYRPTSRGPLEHDFLFAGHIPAPWSTDELARVVHQGPRGTLTFGELLEQLRVTPVLANGGRQVAPHALRDAVTTVVEMSTGEAIRSRDIDDRILRYDIQVRLVRMENRQRLLTAARRLSDRIVVHGTDNWQLWSEFAPYYRGAINRTDELAAAYRAAYITLHEGLGTHFRVFDCMGAGGTILYRTGSRIEELNEIRELFEPGVHYIDWRADCDYMQHLLSDRRRVFAIGEAAAQLVHAEHSWVKRASRILTDLNHL